jgi:hypothetical protein
VVGGKGKGKGEGWATCVVGKNGDRKKKKKIIGGIIFYNIYINI